MPRMSPYTVAAGRNRATGTRALSPQIGVAIFEKLSGPRSCSWPPKRLGNDEIGARFDTRREIVSHWRRRFFKHGLPGLDERGGGLRPGWYATTHVDTVNPAAIFDPAYKR